MLETVKKGAIGNPALLWGLGNSVGLSASQNLTVVLMLLGFFKLEVTGNTALRSRSSLQ